MTAPDRDAAVAALDNLADLAHRDAATVGDYLNHLEALNNRLAQHAANAGKVLEDGKRELMRVGWDQGYDAGWNDGFHEVPTADCAANPYKETPDE